MAVEGLDTTDDYVPTTTTTTSLQMIKALNYN